MVGVYISLKKGQNLEIWESNCFHVPNHQDLKRERLRGKRGRGERKPQRERQRFRSVGWHRGRIPESWNGWVGRDFRVIPSHPESWTGTPSLSQVLQPKAFQESVLMGLFSHSQPCWIPQLRNKWEKSYFRPAGDQWDRPWSWQHRVVPKLILWDERILLIPGKPDWDIPEQRGADAVSEHPRSQ